MTEKPQGTGLGLPISRQIIEHLGGRLWVESVPGQGATFVFALPVDGGEATMRPSKPHADRDAGASRRPRATIAQEERWGRRS